MIIPPRDNPIWVQRNKGERDVKANIVGTFNCDFNRYQGKVCASARLMPKQTLAEEGDMSTLSAFAYFENSFSPATDYFAVAKTKVLRASSAGNFVDDTWSGTPTTDLENSDMVVFNGQLCVSTETDVAMVSSNVWNATWYSSTLSGGSLGNNPHPMEVISIGSQLLAIADGKNLHTVTIGGVLTKNRLQLDQEINMIRSGSSRAFIFTGGTGGETCKVYEWDGGDTVATRNYKLNTAGVLTAVVKDDVLYVLTYEMEWKVLSGGGFVTVAVFPITHTESNIYWYDNAFFNVPVSQRGACVYNDNILVNVCSLKTASNTLLEKFVEYYPSGVWELNTETYSLTHKFAMTSAVEDDTIRDVGQWVTPLSSTSIPQYQGAIIPIFDTSGDGTIFVSSQVSVYDGYPAPVVYKDDKTQTNRARLWTTQVFSADSQSAFNSIALKYQPMLHADDRIVVKYRTQRKEPILGTVTWASNTSFTVADGNQDGMARAVVGDEVFILNGYGAGGSAHITAITYDAGTYTVTLDEAQMTGMSTNGVSTVVVQNWKKLDSFNDMITTGRTITLPTPATTWIQIMVEIRAVQAKNVVIEEIEIIPQKVK